MTKTSNLACFWEKSLGRIQELYPGLKFSYFEDVFHKSNLNLEQFIIKINEGIPLDYISQTRHFAGHDFYVDKRVLIPRFETELLYEICLDEIKRQPGTRIKMAEVGVGSGCLGLSILADSSKPVDFLAADISKDALDVFNMNLVNIKNEFQYQHKIEILENDRLAGVVKNNFHIIISNPPYIKSDSDRHKVHQTTYGHEPHLALFIKDSTYEQWFSDFFKQVRDCLVDGGCFIMEGHEDHLQMQAASLNHDGWSHIEVRKDLTERNRFLLLRK